MSTLKTNTIKNTDDVEMYLAKAWVNFNGTGTVAIRAAGNVSSITDNGTGDYTVNFTTAFTDANYSPVFGASRDGAATGALGAIENATAPTESALRIKVVATGSTTTAISDREYVSVTIFR